MNQANEHFYYITFDDADVGIQTEVRKIITGYNDKVFIECRQIVTQMVVNRLRMKYDIIHDLKKRGADREPELLRHMRNMLIYELYTRSPGRVIPEERGLLYEEALKALDRMALPADNPKCLSPDLTLLQKTTGYTFRGSNGKNYRTDF